MLTISAVDQQRAWCLAGTVRIVSFDVRQSQLQATRVPAG
jgi:hypothetical protein